MRSNISPSLVAEGKWSYEVKFALRAIQREKVLDWARTHFEPDSHSDSEGEYLVHTLCLDTESLDCYRKTVGSKSTKYRIRAYEGFDPVFAEIKRKKGTRVQKYRTAMGPLDLTTIRDCESGALHHFAAEVRKRELHPVSCMRYRRAAFFMPSVEDTVRVTVDRDIHVASASQWSLTGRNLMPIDPELSILEIKTPTVIPVQLRRLIAELDLVPTPISKFRLGITHLFDQGLERKDA